MREFFLFLHILCAIVGFGGVIIAGPGMSRAVRLKGEEGRAVFETASRQVKISQIFIYAVFVFGLVIVFVTDFIDFSELWLSISMGIYIIALVISLAVLMPSDRRMHALFETQTQEALAELDKLGSRTAMVSGFNHLLFVVILILMIWKPGA